MSRKYVNGFNIKPRAVILTTASKVYIPVNTYLKENTCD